MELLVLTPDECMPLRVKVIEKGTKAAKAAKALFETDEAEGALHLGLKEGDDLLAVASVLPERRDGTAEMWRLRGVSVDPEHRLQGHGRKLVNAMLTITAERGGGLWCLCPEPTTDFLLKCGLKAEGEPVKAGRGKRAQVMVAPA